MLVTIPDLFTPEQLEAVRSVLRQGKFVDGKLSAGRNARKGKHNQELAAPPADYEALNNVVMTNLVQHPLYLQTAMPARISAPIYARYTSGMEYGGHIDNPIMGPAQARYRSDISITVFLSQPDEYDGGELRIESTEGATAIKLPAGQALLYPASRLHSIQAVTAGERLVAIAWVQSLIRRADQREILVQLGRTRAKLDAEGHPGALDLEHCYANLFRLWAEP